MQVGVIALDQVAGNTNVERAERLVGEDMDARLALKPHGSVSAARWMLKQVQHDGMG